jgi:hypothetical protein
VEFNPTASPSFNQWNATPVADQMALAAPLSSIGRIRPSLRTPKTARKRANLGDLEDTDLTQCQKYRTLCQVD